MSEVLEQELNFDKYGPNIALEYISPISPK